jgi:hypothetical protein
LWIHFWETAAAFFRLDCHLPVSGIYFPFSLYVVSTVASLPAKQAKEERHRSRNWIIGTVSSLTILSVIIVLAIVFALCRRIAEERAKSSASNNDQNVHFSNLVYEETGVSEDSPQNVTM